MSAIIHIPIQKQINRYVESIKEARISGKPIQFICTKDLKIVEDLLSDSRIAPIEGRFVTSKDVQPNLLYSLSFPENASYRGWCLQSESRPQQRTLYVLRLYTTDENNREYQVLMQQLTKFVEVYAGVVRSCALNMETNMPEEPYPELLNSAILVVTPYVPKLSPNIAMYSKIIRVRPLSGVEFYELITRLVEAYDGVTLSHEEANRIDSPVYEYLKEMERHLRGINQTKIEQIFAIIKSRLGRVYFHTEWEACRQQVCRIIREEKLSFVETSDVLKQVGSENASEPVGLEKLKRWTEQRREKIIHYNEQKNSRAAGMPKGILMSGIPGSGKSMTAKYIANILQLPLLKLDFGDVLDKYQGNSEHRMQAALDTALEMSPCVLWIDEIEKAFSGVNSSNEPSSKRMVSKFLTWMQEKENEEACCFVFATANSIVGMPPELFRSGRFDAKFYTFLPSLEDCVKIFKQTLAYQNMMFKQTHEDTELFCEAELVTAFRQLLNNPNGLVLRDGKFFTGSDITALIEDAKDEYACNYPIHPRQKYVYETKKFVDTLGSILDFFKTYGETNLRDCAECFSQICYTNFLPAANPVLLTDKRHYSESRTDVFVMNDGADSQELKNEYDKQMYRAISAVIKDNIQLFQQRREGRKI